MNPLDSISRFAAADPLWALFVSGVLIAALLGVLWAWSEAWRGTSW
jgi:low affinity Fe/Cu permease